MWNECFATATDCQRSRIRRCEFDNVESYDCVGESKEVQDCDIRLCAGVNIYYFLLKTSLFVCLFFVCGCVGVGVCGCVIDHAFCSAETW